MTYDQNAQGCFSPNFNVTRKAVCWINPSFRVIMKWFLARLLTAIDTEGKIGIGLCIYLAGALIPKSTG